MVCDTVMKWYLCRSIREGGLQSRGTVGRKSSQGGAGRKPLLLLLGWREARRKSGPLLLLQLQLLSCAQAELALREGQGRCQNEAHANEAGSAVSQRVGYHGCRSSSVEKYTTW